MAKKRGRKCAQLRPNVYQSNPLIQARKHMDTIELRLFLLGLRGINPHLSPQDKRYDTEFKEIFIPTEKLTELFGGNTWYLHGLEDVCNKLFDTKITLRFEDGGWELYHLFRKMKYVPAEGLYIHFEELLRPYLLDLFQARGYTKIDVEQVFHLTSPYAVRLVELLLQYQNMPDAKRSRKIERELTIEEVRFTLNVPDDAYEGRVDNFRKFVLDYPIREINEKTIYKMSYQVVKTGGTGGRVKGFKFLLDMSGLPVEEELEAEYGNAISVLMDLGFGKKAAEAIAAKCAGEEDCLNRIKQARKALADQKARLKISNELGFLRSFIESGWEYVEPVTKKPRKSTPATKPKLPRAQPAAQKTPPKPAVVLPPMKLPTAEEFRAGETPPSAAVIDAVRRAVYTQNVPQAINLLLKMNGLTLERFTELYMRQE